MKEATSHRAVLQAEREALGLDDESPGTALSISGGGIRSATFALGVIQALAQRKLLKFDYLSTVSGGGYIGGWLTAWKHRRGSMDTVVAALSCGYEEDGSLSAAESGQAIEAPEISYLRRYSNYLTPKLGITSFDFWAIISTVIRNILVNWTVLIPALMTLLFLPRIFVASLSAPDHYFYPLIYPDGRSLDEGIYDNPLLDVFAANVINAYVLPAMAVFFFAVAQSNVLRYLPGLGGVSHTRRDYFLWVLLPLVLSVWSLNVWNADYFSGTHNGAPGWSSYGWGGLAALVLALVIAMSRGLKPTLSLVPPAILTFLIPAIWAWAVYNHILWDGDNNVDVFSFWSWAQYSTYSLPLVLLGVAAGLMIMAGMTANFLGDDDLEWFSRANGGIILISLGWFFLSFSVLVAPLILFTLTQLVHDSADLSLSGLFSAIGVVLGWFVSRQAKNSDATAAEELSLRRKLFTAAATFLFLFILVVSLSLLTNVLLYFAHSLVIALSPEGSAWLVFSQLVPGAIESQATWLPLGHDSAWWQGYRWNEHQNIIVTSNPIILVLVALFLYASSRVYGLLVNTNKFSLQGMYRNRLVRAYLGASNDQRKANQFTGFDPNDDIRLHEMDPTLKPFHVVNLALNLVGGSKLEWQQRKASSFTASALFCGNKDLGYRASNSYGGRKGMSLGTAVATSGAAASPNMGYNSSPVTTFIMTLFNARLGIWQGNPRNEAASRRSSPRSAFTSLVGEALGRTSSEGDYIYLSDGGHFENLALYEMVARGCSDILVIDGGCDPDTAFEDLGNATRKIEIDDGIQIDFLPGHISNIQKKASRCALAYIRYGGGREDGRLIYVKPMVRGNESPSVISYATRNETFPHESTSDQWFSESQTESYRLLGWTSMMEITAGFDGGSMEELFEHIRENTPEGVDSAAEVIAE